MNKKSFIILSLSFAFITFFTIIFSIVKYTESDSNVIELKKDAESIKTVLEKSINNPPSRFTSFFYYKNITFLKNIDDYRYSYNIFSKDTKDLYDGISSKIEYIDKLLIKKEQLPAFVDNNTNYLFYPISYNKINNINELEKISDKLLINVNNQDINENIVKAGKFLNYLFIEIADKKFIILISPPYDPDPLHPDNKRDFLIIGIKKNEYNKYSYYSDNFILKRDK